MTQRRVLGLALPIIGENLLQTIVGAVDTLLVARLGSYAVAGVGTSLEIVFFLISVLSAVAIGATVLISQAIGAGNSVRANQVARQAIVWGLVLALPVSLGGYFAAPTIITVFGTEPDVAHAATTYLQITAATSITLLLSFVCGAILRGAGDSRTPLVASLLANVVNVVAAIVLIFGYLGAPALGVAGSAWAAALARAAGAGLLLTLLVRGRRAVSLGGQHGWMPRASIARQLMRLGIPSAVEQILMAGGFTTMVAVVAALGTASLAAQQIGFTALSIAFMPGFGFAIAATALVGQSIGAHRIADARAAARIATYWSIGWMTVGGLLYFVFAGTVMRVFTNDQEVITLGVRAIRALSIGLPFWALWWVSGGALRGSGDTRTPMFMSATAVWLAVALAWVLVTWFDGGVGTVWLTFFVTAPLGALGNWLMLRRRLAPDSRLWLPAM
ncbi:MAG: MATE family efflux transporter [Chloroflexota bacterium]|nr:MATE family efflux transporter [Chloroflexota bacterium]